MTSQELDRLLAGAQRATLTLTNGERPHQVHFTRHELQSPVAWRAALRRQLGHLGYEPPVYGVEDHDVLVRAIVRLRRRGRACAQRGRNGVIWRARRGSLGKAAVVARRV